MDIIVLAGAKNTGALRAVTSCAYEAGIPLAGRPLLDYIVEPLSRIREAGRLVVVGPEDCLSPDRREKVWRIVPAGDSMLENLRRGLAALAPKEKVLVATADIPLITEACLEDFLARCRAREADVYYPIVEKGLLEAHYPGAKRTYAALREGVFTGGNIVLLSPEILEGRMEVIESAVALRKKPIQMARLLGLYCLLKLILGRLSIAEVERRVEQKLHFKGAAVITPFAEIGIDVDKPSDLALVREVLAAQI